MLDLCYLAIGVVGFVALWGIARACESRVGGHADVRLPDLRHRVGPAAVYLGWAMFRPEKF